MNLQKEEDALVIKIKTLSPEAEAENMARGLIYLLQNQEDTNHADKHMSVFSCLELLKCFIPDEYEYKKIISTTFEEVFKKQNNKQ